MAMQIFMIGLTSGEPKHWKASNGKNGAYLERDDNYQRLSFDRNLNIDIQSLNNQIAQNKSGLLTVIRSVNVVGSTVGEVLLNIPNKDNLNPLLLHNTLPAEGNDIIMLTVEQGTTLIGYEMLEKFVIKTSCRSQPTKTAFIYIPQTVNSGIIRVHFVTEDDRNNVQTVLVRYENRNVTVLQEDSSPVTASIEETLSKNNVDFRVKYNRPVTRWYITTSFSEEKLNSILDKYGIKSRRVIVVDDRDDHLEIRRKLETIQENPSVKVRAITTYGMKLPSALIRDFKLTYVFAMKKTGELDTIRSN